MISFILSVIWLFGGIASILYYRMSDYFKNINNYDLWLVVNLVVGLPIAMLSWFGLIMLVIFNKVIGKNVSIAFDIKNG